MLGLRPCALTKAICFGYKTFYILYQRPDVYTYATLLYLPLNRKDVSWPKCDHSLTESQATQDGPNGWAPGWISSGFALTVFQSVLSIRINAMPTV